MEVVSLHHSSLWMLLCILQLFVLCLVVCSTAGCSNDSCRTEPSQNFIQNRRRKAHHSLFVLPASVPLTDFHLWYSALSSVWNLQVPLAKIIFMMLTRNGIQLADQDTSRRVWVLKCLPVSECRNCCYNKRRFRT